MALTAVCKFFGLKPDFTILPPPLPREIVPANDEVERKLQLYNPLNDSEALKSHPEKFEYLRGNYPLRREHW
jgi:erythronate-4-phosphate dehydrogenase